MLKTVYAVAISAIVAAFITLPGLLPDEARAQLWGAKADRADTRPLARACSRNAWPYFEAPCLRDTRNSFGEASAVRLVTVDRLAPIAAAR